MLAAYLKGSVFTRTCSRVLSAAERKHMPALAKHSVAGFTTVAPAVRRQETDGSLTSEKPKFVPQAQKGGEKVKSDKKSRNLSERYSTQLPVGQAAKFSPQVAADSTQIGHTKQLQSVIENFKESDKSSANAVIEALRTARAEGVPLNAQHLIAGINACVVGKRDDNVLDLANWAFNILHADKIASIEVYEFMMNLCYKYNDLPRAAELHEGFLKQGYSYTSYFLSPYITLSAKSATDEQMGECLKLYEALKDVAAKKNFVIGARAYMVLAERLCRMGLSEEVLGVLKDLTAQNHEPSPALCGSLLATALLVGDTAVLRVLLNWYKVNFNVGLLDGQANHALSVAANAGDAHLGLAAFQMLRESGMEPTPSQYYKLVRALLMGGDLVSGTEALQEMERVGASCFVTRPGGAEGETLVGAASSRPQQAFDHGAYLSVKSMLVENICGTGERPSSSSYVPSKQQLDALYFGLVEQVRGGSEEAPVAVPRVVLDALIQSAGRVGQLDRAFRIFQETSSIFGVTPDLTTYNALLAACAARVVVPMATVFQVFQDIETTFLSQPEWKGSAAADYSFSILLDAMFARKEFRLLSKVVDHMLLSGAVAQPNSLRNAAVGMALMGSDEAWAEVEKVKGVLLAQRMGLRASELGTERLLELAAAKDKRSSYLVSASFLRRLTTIRDAQLKKRGAMAAVQEGKDEGGSRSQEGGPVDSK